MKLGRTGVKVSNLCLGSDSFGNPFGSDQGTSHQIMDNAFDAGINFLDTSDSYSIGDSERVIGNYFRASGSAGPDRAGYEVPVEGG